MAAKWWTKLSDKFRFDELILKQDKVYILPTQGGATFIAGILVLFLISLVYGNALAFTATVVFFALVFSSAFLTNFNLFHVELKSLRALSKFYEGDLVECEVELMNKSKNFKGDIEVGLKMVWSGGFLNIQPHQSLKGSYQLGRLSRGAYHIKRVKLVTSYPFGLFRSWKYLEKECFFWVYPTPRADLKLPLTGHVQEETSEMSYHSQLGDEEYYQHRKYQDGDPWKNIDWKALAREKGLLTKVFHTPRSQKLNFRYDDLKNYPIEEALGILTYWCLEAYSRKYSFQLVLPRTTLEVDHHSASLERALRSLAEFQKERVTLW